MKAGLLCAALLFAAADASAQSDPIRCWWRTSHGAVAIGEPFDATLTCAVREQGSTRTVPDENRLPAAVVQLAPFEVLGGTHPADLRSPTHRFFQYHYHLRVIDRDLIGRDARFPDVQVPFRVHTLTNGEWMAGRDRSYSLPGQAVRVLSLVPADAADIRDSGEADFAHIEALRFRSRAFEIGAYALAALGVIVAVPAVVALARRSRRTGAPEIKALSRRQVMAAAEERLAAIERDSRQGWTSDLAARALATLRIATAAAAGRDVASRPLDGQISTPAGRLVVTRGLLQKRHFEVSSALTPLDLRQMDARDLAAALQTLTAAVYGSTAALQDGSLDEAFATARRAIRDMGRSR